MDARVACHKSATATGQHRATWCGTARHGMAWHSYNVQRSTAAFDMCSTFSPVLFTGFAFVLQPAYCCIFVGCQLQCPLLLLTPHTVRMPFIGFFAHVLIEFTVYRLLRCIAHLSHRQPSWALCHLLGTMQRHFYYGNHMLPSVWLVLAHWP